ncbi:phage tail tape measure protein, partial [Bacillus thuringiensis]|nr:phage tail tape measure protein [Bacillus thuringiensis]
VAEAYEYMALAGWDSNQMIAASKPLLDLATAGALDLAKASDIVTDTMTPFGMKASEAGRVADVFALAQATANLNVEQLG